MKVKELINLLKQYEDYYEVKIISENWGIYDIKEVNVETKVYTYEQEVDIFVNIKVE